VTTRIDLTRYRRTERPDLEAVPAPPESAATLLTASGLRFVLVREAVRVVDGVRTCCWFTWRDDVCVGFLSTYLDRAIRLPYGTPPRAPVGKRRVLTRGFMIWQARVTNGYAVGLAEVPSQRQGIMTAAYLHIIKELSSFGCALASNPKARNRGAKALWRCLETHPSVQIVKSRARERHYAIWRPQVEWASHSSAPLSNL
jgi:hypothetical protein